jgi:serine/threonine protein kinase
MGGAVPPELIAGRYRVEREVGRGGMGSVWLCRDERLGRPVAVKQVGGLPGESSMHLARALREARHSAALNHPNVVAIFDALEEGHHVWLVMEYVPSRTLDGIVHEDGPLPPAVAASIGADVADGLAAAHALGTVHRDVKPSNILVRDDDQRALIADFGIARTVGQEQLTRSGLVTGTPAYFAPELARGHEPTPASDVWALGVSLYFAVEGEPPYPEQANAIAMLNTIAHRPPPEPTRAGPLTPILQRMLDPDAGTRCSMAQAAVALRDVAVVLPAPMPRPSVEASPAAVGGTRPADTVPTRTPTAPPPSPPSPPPAQAPQAPPEPRRRPQLMLVAAVVLLALAVSGGWWLTRDPGETSGADRTRGSAPSSAQPSTSPSTSPATPSSPAEATPSGTSTPPASSPAPSPTSSSASPIAESPDSPADFVVEYYGLLPEDTESSWQMLSPELQNRIGRGTFEGFWATIDELSVDGAEETGDGQVDVTLTYTSDGRSEQETRRLEVERLAGGFLITGDQGAI